ncbi:hypothetical protein Catovirus_2_270 [Catovirus CTV1]|uniref:C3H1-type domain-containing protein n=1 Tax=Catovirus CTV1 TaxID=1977631 RepID=A0A1V0SCA7_9VIRU|nr:hypothetical protein Catovirus_2_270 [Catovirus CTV1]
MDNKNDKWITVETKKNKQFQQISKFSKFDYLEKNQKKMLCNNILKNKKCTYGNKCMYAHNLEEQNVDFIKKKAYDILNSSENINIDLSKDEKLAKTFLQFTKLCDECKNKVCQGGYNCKYGTIDEKYLICHEDLMNGVCSKTDCKLIHLTKRGIKSIIPSIRPKSDINKKRFIREINDGMILNDDFFVNLGMTMTGHTDEIDSDGESAESIEKIKGYLEEYDSDEDCDKSIFIYQQ